MGDGQTVLSPEQYRAVLRALRAAAAPLALPPAARPKPGRRTVTWTFADGSRVTVRAAWAAAQLREKRAAWRGIRRRIWTRNGAMGGRPSAAPTKGDIVLRYGNRWLSRWNEGPAAARAWLVHQIATESDKEGNKDERQARRWVRAALGPAPRKRRTK